jgi:hypothetical protein
MIALLNAILSLLLGALIDDGLGAGTWLLTHVGQSRQRTRRGVSAREEGSSSKCTLGRERTHTGVMD